MIQLKEYFRLALLNIKSNKVRTFLTMLGIIIGVSSVILIISLGNGVKEHVNGTLNDMAGGQIVVQGSPTDSGESVFFNTEDIRAIEEKIDGVKGGTFYLMNTAYVSGIKGEHEAEIKLGTESLKYDSKDPLIYGRYFTKEEVEAAKPVCVIREKSAKALFGTADVVGMSIELNARTGTEQVQIVGVRKDNASALYNMVMSSGDDVMDIEMPYSNYVALIGSNRNEFAYIYVYTEATADYQRLVPQVKSLLEARHDCRGSNGIIISDFSSELDSVSSIMDTISLFVVFVAAISLLVGGIGVMTIMLVSVTERTREIGIRKSLGARTGTIMMQFLCEAAIITLIAGIIGIILGSCGASAVGNMLGVDTSVDLRTVILASVFSTFVGVFFGIYPAKKAAKLSPIEALRHE